MDSKDLETLNRLFPYTSKTYEIRSTGNIGLIIVDPGRGFTRQGNLADPVHMVPMLDRIADLYDDLKDTLAGRLHVLIFLDTHEADIPEPPYPPHCIVGTGEELIDRTLQFFPGEPQVTVIRKDCINGFVGAIDPTTEDNAYTGWVIHNQIETLLFCGDCTDICVSDLVCTSLSARNHGLFTDWSPVVDRKAYAEAITSMDLVVMVGECETFDAPAIGHYREAAHHAGLWMMASRGAILASNYVAT